MAQAQAVQNVPKGSGDGSMTTGNPANPTDWSVGWHPLFWGCGLIMLANVLFLVLELRLYVHRRTELGKC